MTVNERIKQIRLHRRLPSRELAERAAISVSEISLIETKMRTPKTETLQRVAAALEVSSSYLLSELNADLPLESALTRESLQIFLRDAKLPPEQKNLLWDVAEKPSAPQTVKGWKDLIANFSAYEQSLHRRS
jgi:transcriptional regulator with XRE-family HTH domain